MTSRWVALLCASVIGLAVSCPTPARATVLPSPDCDEARGWDLIARARDTRGGVTLSIQDAGEVSTTIPDSFGWRGEHSHYFELSYSAVTGTLRFGLDVSRNRVLETTEVLSRTFDSYLYRSFLRAGISVSGAGGSITDLTVNGTSLGSLSFSDHAGIERDILRTNQALRDILITGTLVFGGVRGEGDWPDLRLRLGDDVAYTLQVPGGLSIGEPTAAAVFGMGLAGWLLARRRGRACVAK